MLTLKQGKFLVKKAREIIECFVRKKEWDKNFPKWCEEKRGVFVTLHTYPEHKLRGCIGIIEGFELKEALEHAATGVCNDPRFPSLKENELDKIIVEVSVLTRPEEIKFKGEEIFEKIEKLKDGLIIEKDYHKGLFLPQVWKEINDKEEFLNHLCLKAGLMPDEWKDARIYKFNVQAFEEIKPRGDVIVKKIG